MPGVTTKRKPADLVAGWDHQIDDYVQALAWSPHGEWLAAASVSGLITVLHAATGEVAHLLPGHAVGTTALTWHPKDAIFASCGQDGVVRVWDAPAGRERFSLLGGAAWIERVDWSADGTYLAAAAGKSVRVWDAKGQVVRTYADHPSTVLDVRWKPKSQVLASTAYSLLQLWDPVQAEPLNRFEWRGSSLAMAWSPNGRYLATGDQDSTVHFWIVKTGRDLQMWGYPTKVRELSWDCTSRYLATGGSKDVTVWDCSGRGPANTRPLVLEAHTTFLSALAFQHRGAMLVSGGEDGQVVVWRPGLSKRPVARAALGDAVSAVAWSPDDQRIAVGTADGLLEVFASP